MPVLGIIFAASVPVVLVLMVGDMSGLADLYAVGVVGAIATNLGREFDGQKPPARPLGARPDVRDLSRHAGDRDFALHR